MKQYTGTRAAFAAALSEMAQMDDRILFLSADSLKAMRAAGFAEQFPDRYVEAGISEQGAVDMAAGLASCGLIPFVGTYAGFLTMRACEQIRTFVAYPELNVKFIGINGGLIGGEREGVTHQFYEDVAILSAIPNISIFTPADAQQTYEAVKEAARCRGPVYIRAGSGREPDFYPEGTPFSMEGCRMIRNYGERVLILSSGFVLDRALDAVETLYARGVDACLCDVNMIRGRKPEQLSAYINRADCILTVEDHSIHGGLGAYVSELVCRYHPVRVERIGLQDTFGESGSADELADKYGLSSENIVRTVLAMYEGQLDQNAQSCGH